MSRMNTNREKAKEKAKDNSGNWEYTPYRKLPAETILRDLLSPNSFDPRKVNEIRNPPKSKKQLIYKHYILYSYICIGCRIRTQFLQFRSYR
jgi:hypothetical protein